MQDEMTADQLKAKFPNASEAFLRRNAAELPAILVSGALVMKPNSERSKNRLRQSAKGPNKWEREFAEHLRSQNHIVWEKPIKFRLANGVTYEPDLMAHFLSINFYEVKGFMRDDAAVKLKVAASMYPCFHWYLVWKDKGEWKEQRIIP